MNAATCLASRNEGDAWKLRQVQFQFDLDLSPLLVLQMVLLGWMGVNMVWLLVAMYRHWTIRRREAPATRGDR